MEFPPWPCVYAVSATYRLIKIGHSTNFAQRFADLQHACPHRLRVVGTMPGGPDEERTLHHMYRRFRRQGEWFNLPKPVRLQLEAILAGEVPLDTQREERQRMARVNAKATMRHAGLLPSTGQPKASKVKRLWVAP